MMRIVDFHCHLDLFPNFQKLGQELEHARIDTLAVTTTPRAWAGNVAALGGLRFVRIGLGLHPQLVAAHAHEISLWRSLLPETRYVAEVGLDRGPAFFSSYAKQVEVFEAILRACEEEGGKILSVHSVRAAGPVLEMIDRFLSRSRRRIVLHWFTGTTSEARRALELGCYFSINGAMIERHRQLVENLPLDRILTETDGPFTKTGIEPSSPRDVVSVLARIAAIRRIEADALAAAVGRNLDSLEQ